MASQHLGVLTKPDNRVVLGCRLPSMLLVMRARSRRSDPTGHLPFPPQRSMSAIAHAGAARPAPRHLTEDIIAGLQAPLGQVRSQVQSVARAVALRGRARRRRTRFYLDVAGATFVMALFVAAAALV